MSVHICAYFLTHISALHNEKDTNAKDFFLRIFSATENLDGSDGKSVRVA